jgi:hypothetical protein
LGFFKGENKMGRPLKIQKYGTAQGVTYPSSTSANQPAAAVGVDIGFPPFSALTNPVYPSGGTFPAWTGVVGGTSSAATSASYPIVKCEVNIANSYTGRDPGQIIRQKGAHKYLVATTAGIDPENAVIGQGVALRILTVGDTDWNAMGLVGTPAVGAIFTPTSAAGSGTSGTAQEVGVCVLTSDLTPGAGLMSISYFQGDSSEVAISKLTNKFLLNWNNFQNASGTSLDSYASGGDNAGSVVYSGEDELLTNFFTDEGTMTKSGSEQNASLDMAIVENYTS